LTCYRRLWQWEEDGSLLKVCHAYLSALDGKGRLKWEGCFDDGSFASAKKRGLCIGKTKRVKGTKWMVVVDGKGIPLAYHLNSASPAEVKLIEKTLENIRVPRSGRGHPRKKVKRLIYDKAVYSDPSSSLKNL
jgi:hypothetical protein